MALRFEPNDGLAETFQGAGPLPGEPDPLFAEMTVSDVPADLYFDRYANGDVGATVILGTDDSGDACLKVLMSTAEDETYECVLRRPAALAASLKCFAEMALSPRVSWLLLLGAGFDLAGAPKQKSRLVLFFSEDAEIVRSYDLRDHVAQDQIAKSVETAEASGLDWRVVEAEAAFPVLRALPRAKGF